MTAPDIASIPSWFVPMLTICAAEGKKAELSSANCVELLTALAKLQQENDRLRAENAEYHKAFVEQIEFNKLHQGKLDEMLAALAPVVNKTPVS